jgi:hypothetical protein
MTKQQDGNFETATTELNEAELDKATGGASGAGGGSGKVSLFSSGGGGGAGKVTFNPFRDSPTES